MKLYIPTTTENFNNILSSESISPLSYYRKRGFGYSILKPVAPNSLEDRILLYQGYPVYETNDSSVESYPLVIEVETHSEDDYPIYDADSSIHFEVKTIYLNPFEVRFIFRDENEKRFAITNSERSIETKLVALYSSTFVVKTNDIKDVEWSEISNAVSVLPTTDNDNCPILEDSENNRLKGFLYGYILGANKSIDNPAYLKLVCLTNKLSDAYSVAINRPSGTGNDDHNKYLAQINKTIDEYFSKEIDEKERERACPIAEAIREQLCGINKDPEGPEKDDGLVIDKLIEFNKSFAGYKPWLRDALNSRRASVEPFLEKSVAELQKYILRLRGQIESYFPSHKLEIQNFPLVLQGNVSEIPGEESLLVDLINGLLSKRDLICLLSKSRYEFARECGSIFKDCLEGNAGINWAGSNEQAYINGLLKNLNENETFDLRSSDNLILRSLAAFCKKGESGELDSFHEYLITNGIGDVRIAFAIWGAIFGFAAMPKTITNELFGSEDTEYISTVYKFIHKQVFGQDLLGELVRESPILDPQVTLAPAAVPNLVQQPVSNIQQGAEFTELEFKKFKKTTLENPKTLEEYMPDSWKKKGAKINPVQAIDITIKALNETTSFSAFNKQLKDEKILKKTKYLKEILGKTSSVQTNQKRLFAV
jgi:hypothetical protein